MKHIISLSYSSYGTSGDEIYDFDGEEIRISQYNLGFNFELAASLIKEYDGRVDAFSLNGIPPIINSKEITFMHPEIQKLASYAKVTPLFDGSLIKKTYLPWALRKFHYKNPKFFASKKISIYSGAFNYSLLDDLTSFGSKIKLGDPYFYLGVPKLLRSKAQLTRFAKFLTPVFKKMKIKHSKLGRFTDLPNSFKPFLYSDYFMGNASTFHLLDLSHLEGKTVIVDFLSASLEEKFKAVGVENCLVCMPKLMEHEHLSFSLIEALIYSCYSDDDRLTDQIIIGWMESRERKDELVHLIDLKKCNREKNRDSLLESKTEGTTKFAFIVHPLSKKHLFRHPLLKPLLPISRPLLPIAEEVISAFPGFYWGKMKGIRSEKNGREVEGLIYMMTETPKKLMEKDVDKVYRRLIRFCYQAHDKGAKIIGLGAYTKIVGDAGVSVNERSPIPVTTGNSLSACATLWAAKFALERLNLVDKVDGRYKGRVMVVGATGSIGAVSAKILAQNWDEIVLVAPRAYKILELKEEIEEIDSEVKIHVSTDPDDYSSSCDLIITTTSAQGKKILDIDKVKSGAIICDVSRPFDISEEDALSRPDVMVIASGEVMLPGPVDFKVDLGLEGNIVYACLAETALLAMDGTFESFTLSRVISYEKVLEIDRMASEHGVKLSCIMGHNGFIGDDEFDLCREHVKRKLEVK